MEVLAERRSNGGFQTSISMAYNSAHNSALLGREVTGNRVGKQRGERVTLAERVEPL